MLRKSGKLIVLCPVELTAVNDYAAHYSTVTADELCSGVNNDVNTVLDRSEEIWCSESAVNNERNAVLVSDCSNSFKVDNV